MLKPYIPTPGSALHNLVCQVIIEGKQPETIDNPTSYTLTNVKDALRKIEETGGREGILSAWRSQNILKTEAEIARLALHGKTDDIRLRASRTMQEMHGALKPQGPTGTGNGSALIQINIGARGEAAKPKEVRPGVVQGAEPMPIIIDA